MNRSESNKVRTKIKKSAINTKAIRDANKLLVKSGMRICRYSGELLELNSKNFHKNNAKACGFQSVSKLGHYLYNSGQLEVKEEDRAYEQHDPSIVQTA